MNQKQRKQLSSAIQALSPFGDAEHCLEQGHAAVLNAVEEAKSVFQGMADDEREKFDNLPEAFRNGDRAAAMEEAADSLEFAVDDLDNADLSERVTLEEGWHDDVAGFIQEAIDTAAEI